MSLPDPPLLVVTDRSLARRPLPEVAEAVFAAGCRWLSLREKDLPGDERGALLGELVEIGARFGATVTVHADVEAARAVGAVGVHLPRDGDPAAARATLGPGALIGISTHDEHEVAAAERAGAAYATLSPLFESASKPGYPGLGPERFAAIAAGTTLPLIALGGIDAGNAPDAMKAGAAGVAVMGGVMRAADPGAVVAALLEAMSGHAARRA